MDIQEIMKRVDHTVLSPTATTEDIEQCVEDAVAFGCATAMVPPCFVDQAYAVSGGRIPIATVIGFPHGNSTTAAKVAEAADAVANGASEIDMVANISWIKDGRWAGVENDIRQVKEAIGGRCLKVIIECCLLSPLEQIEMCRVCAAAGADYIKTSTGFSTGGATADNVRRLAENAPDGLRVKAAGGISGFEDATLFIELGAERLGTSKLVKIAKEG